MTQATEAANLLITFFRHFEAAATLIPVLEQAGSIENSLAEKQVLVADLAGRLDTLNTQLEAAQRDLTDARTSAGKILADAKSKAAGIVEQAEGAAQAEKAEAARAAAEATDQLAAIQAQIVVARSELAALEARKADQEAAIAAELEAARKRLGG
jgi:chromosome segregation ATPase